MSEITLLHGDCLELMKQIPDGSVDLVLCDPPFAITQNKWDVKLNLSMIWDELHRVAKHNAAFVIHCFQPFTTDLIVSNRRNFKYLWYWNKHCKTGFLNAKKQPLRQVEEIAVFYRKQPVFTPPLKKAENMQDASRRVSLVQITGHKKAESQLSRMYTVPQQC